MKTGKLKKLGVLLAAQLVSAAGLFCAIGSAGEPGTAAASFLKFTPSPRATAMGESYSSVTEDAYAAYWNPAGLASIPQPEFAATYNASFEEVTHQYASFAYPLRYGSTLNLNFTRLSVSPFQGYDAGGLKTKMVESSDMAIGLGYGRMLMRDSSDRPVLNAGVNVKTISETLDAASASAFAADLGLLYYMRRGGAAAKGAQEFRFALTARNLGGGLKFNQISSPLPMSVTLGTSWITHPRGDSLILSMDNTTSNDDKHVVNLGAEYVALQLMALRAGYCTGQAQGSGARFGIGFKLPFMDLDYSMSPFGELGSMHKLGASMKFGTLAARVPQTARAPRAESSRLAPAKSTEKLSMYANDYLKLAKKSLDMRRYVAAETNFNKAFSVESDLRTGDWGDKATRLTTLINELRLKDTPGLEGSFANNSEQSNIGHEALMAYVNGEDTKAFLLAHAAWGANTRGEPVFESLLYTLGELTRNTVRRDEILPRTALVKEKLRKAAKAFYIQQFELAVTEGEEVLMLDESNVIGWTRLGSAYFMIGDKVKARKAYKSALALSPGDTVIRQFMESQGWK